MEPLVRFDGVRKSFDGATQVVRDLSLDIASGELLTLLGPSGSGKTTTLMMLAGFERPDAGDIQMAGRSVLGLAPHKRGIGVVFQNFALFPHMNVAENIAFPLQVRRVSRADQQRRVADAFLPLRENAFPRGCVKLAGTQSYRIRVGDYRIIYCPDTEKKIVRLLAVGHRRESS